MWIVLLSRLVMSSSCNMLRFSVHAFPGVHFKHMDSSLSAAFVVHDSVAYVTGGYECFQYCHLNLVGSFTAPVKPSQTRYARFIFGKVT